MIFDPPFHVSVGRPSDPTAGFGKDPWTDVSSLDSVIEWTKPHAEQASRVIRPGGAMVVMGGTQSLVGWDYCASKYGFHWMAELIILWNAGKVRRNSFGSLHTRVVWYAKSGLRHTFNSKQVSIYSNVMVAKKVPESVKRHPSEKPVGVTNFLVSLLTKSDDLVVDPFCGSGSTLVSADLADRRWLGSDLDQKYVDITNSRVDNSGSEHCDPVHLWINGRLQEV